jgi:hypothetical protein
MNRDLISKIIGFTRHANSLGRLQNELRADIFDLEREFKEMIKRHWSYIMLHHSLTKDGETVSWQAMRRYHMSYRIDGVIVAESEFSRRKAVGEGKLFEVPWKDIAYHFGIELVNKEYEILVGRNLDEEGAHCPQQGMNQKGIGICFVGNFDEGPVPLEQWNKGVVFVASLIKLLDIQVQFIVGHHNYAPKTCPGKLFEVLQFRKAVLCEL